MPSISAVAYASTSARVEPKSPATCNRAAGLPVARAMTTAPIAAPTAASNPTTARVWCSATLPDCA